ncbi:putative phosphoenolpyruvate synthase [Trichonephila clavipes]|nr:putative phosphoenolpyruvate synthase [Trichonephila clavipes]
MKCADEVVFYGVNSKSECLLVRIARSDSKVANAWIYLKLCNGKTYSLTETVDHQQLSDGKCQTFSCGKLQMHYLSPMRRWRIFFSGMLKERSDGKKDCEDSVFVKFVFLWKAASDVYDCTLDTNLKGLANAMARSGWKSSLSPPVKEFTEIVNCYAQTGVLNGTVSINDGPEILFGEWVALSLGILFSDGSYELPRSRGGSRVGQNGSLPRAANSWIKFAVILLFVR